MHSVRPTLLAHLGLPALCGALRARGFVTGYYLVGLGLCARGLGCIEANPDIEAAMLVSERNYFSTSIQIPTNALQKGGQSYRCTSARDRQTKFIASCFVRPAQPRHPAVDTRVVLLFVALCFLLRRPYVLTFRTIPKHGGL